MDKILTMVVVFNLQLLDMKGATILQKDTLVVGINKTPRITFCLSFLEVTLLIGTQHAV